MQKQFIGIAALSAALSVADASHAQAVQWRTQDGGNGHWYRFVDASTTWLNAAANAAAKGAHLGTITSAGEQGFAASVLQGRCAWIGARRVTASTDCHEGWNWVTGEPFGFANWYPGEPNGCAFDPPYVDQGACINWCWHFAGQWNDQPIDWTNCLEGSLHEWSADCNNDGIVDYGQCRDGSLPDYNGNDVPDCCESEMPCETSNYAVQWRIEDGGNGRWYQALLTSAPILWSDARDAARSRGGRLISVNSAEEQAFIEPLLTAAVDPEGCNPALFMGLTKVQGQPWQWEDGTVPGFTNWACGEPADPDYLEGKMVMFNPAACEPYCVPHLRWNDIRLDDLHPLHRGMVIEWSADCNDDGIVDYGQILQGQLPDTNQNGVPDSCETPDCTSADLFRDFNVNGADLGILLAQWGPVNSLTVSDLNNDGAVDGSDLGLLLSFWGPCPG